MKLERKKEKLLRILLTQSNATVMKNNAKKTTELFRWLHINLFLIEVDILVNKNGRKFLFQYFVIYNWMSSQDCVLFQLGAT